MPKSFESMTSAGRILGKVILCGPYRLPLHVLAHVLINHGKLLNRVMDTDPVRK